MSEKRTLLIVEDSAVNQRILAKILMDEYQIIMAKDGRMALTLLDRHTSEISAIILDLVMPVMNGFEFLQAVYSMERYQNLPIIMSTGNSSEEHESKALSLGAWDFISKPYNAQILKFRLQNAIERSQLSAFHQLKYLAEYDALTGLLNKTKFFEETRVMLQKHPDVPFVFIRFDIDRFQLVNSFFGVEEGDRLLRYLAEQFQLFLTNNARCVYGRMEADIFACCIEYRSKERVRKKLDEAKHIVRAYNLSFDIVPTFGLYYLDDLTLPIHVMLDRATLAAKSRKGSYIDTVGEYLPAMSQRITQEQEIVNEMVMALDKRQFEIYIQPKYNLSTNLPDGGEALVRWNHPKQGMISPSVFIPVFEKNGFISRLDFYVWEEVCRLLRKWIDAGALSPHPISVNVSRVNLYNPQIVENICDLMEKYQLPPHLLELELTESAYTDNPQVMRQVVERLREKGFVVLMDDFGTGYSSLSILKDIEVDILKIDMRFLEDSKIPGRGENIVASIIRMAKWLNIPTVAEGVEKAEQIEFLKSISCEYVQGFVFAKPMPIAEFEHLAQSNLEKSFKREENFDLNSLWEETPQMELLFSNATQASCLYEVENDRIEILRANQAYHRMFAIENIKGDSQALENILPEYRQEVLYAFEKSIDLCGFFECDYRAKTIDERVLWVNMKLQCLNRMGSKHVLFGTFFDISIQKNIEEELKKYKIQASVKEDREVSNRLVLVGDAEGGLEILRRSLGKKYTLVEAKSAEEMKLRLTEMAFRVDMILVDDLADAQEEAIIFQYKKSNEKLKEIPMLKIVTYSDFQRYEHILSNGVTDLMMKPFPGNVLLQRVDNVLQTKRRMWEMAREYEAALERAQLDSLTQLQNRSVAERGIAAALSLQAGRMHALLLLDLDNFKEINEQQGHSYGDQMLISLANLLKGFFRKGDIISRFGGDEFCVFLENISLEESLVKQCQSLCQAVGHLEIGTDKCRSTCSIGLAISNADACTFGTLYRRASLALHHAKLEGKNRLILFQPAMEE